jgi:small subunit ribosomal protein S20
MPNIKSAKKRMELSRRAADRNRQKRSRIRTAVKKVHQAEDADTGGTLLKEAVALLDRAAQANLMHPNRAARIKGQLTRHVTGLS